MPPSDTKFPPGTKVYHKSPVTGRITPGIVAVPDPEVVQGTGDGTRVWAYWGNENRITSAAQSRVHFADPLLERTHNSPNYEFRHANLE